MLKTSYSWATQILYPIPSIQYWVLFLIFLPSQLYLNLAHYVIVQIFSELFLLWFLLVGFFHNHTDLHFDWLLSFWIVVIDYCLVLPNRFTLFLPIDLYFDWLLSFWIVVIDYYLVLPKYRFPIYIFHYVTIRITSLNHIFHLSFVVKNSVISIAWEINCYLHQLSNSPYNWVSWTLTLQSQNNKLGLCFPASVPVIIIFDTKIILLNFSKPWESLMKL